MRRLVSLACSIILSVVLSGSAAQAARSKLSISPGPVMQGESFTVSGRDFSAWDGTLTLTLTRVCDTGKPLAFVLRQGEIERGTFDWSFDTKSERGGDWCKGEYRLLAWQTVNHGRDRHATLEFRVR